MKRKFKSIYKALLATALAALMLSTPIAAFAAESSTVNEPTATTQDTGITNTDTVGAVCQNLKPCNSVVQADATEGNIQIPGSSPEQIGTTEDNGQFPDSSPEQIGATEGDSQLSDSSNVQADTGGGESNIFSDVYKKFTDNAADIFSALAFIGSLLIALIYKKRLLPTLTRAISGIEKAIESARKKASEESDSACEKLTGLESKLAAVEESLSSFYDTSSALTEKLALLDSQESDRKRLQTIMLSQIDMLYDVFMSSSLPQYQKDSIGSRVVKMKEEISKNG